MLTLWWMHEPGQRVALMSDCGDRYGTVTKVGTKWLYVQMDSGRKRRFLIEGRDGFAPHVSVLRKMSKNERVSI